MEKVEKYEKLGEMVIDKCHLCGEDALAARGTVPFWREVRKIHVTGGAISLTFDPDREATEIYYEDMVVASIECTACNVIWSWDEFQQKVRGKK